MKPDGERVDATCPVCQAAIRIHGENVAVGAEVLCSACGALLGVEQREPLMLTEIDPEEL